MNHGQFAGVGKTTIVHQFLGREVKIFPATIGMYVDLYTLINQISFNL